MKKTSLIVLVIGCFIHPSLAQMKLTFLNQTWVRFTDNNPGSMEFSTPKNQTFDIGLRRTRMQYYGTITPRVFVYTQVGLNNLAFNSTRKQGIFLHDACAEYVILEKKLSVGSGLTAWNGLSRYASPSIGSILSLDVPLYQQFTNDVSDQFVRKYSIYLKGKLGRLDYRIIASKPMSIEKAAGVKPINENAEFASVPANIMLHGYMMLQTKDQESNQTPYNVGTYLGKKDVLNFGVGAVYQKNAMWYLTTDTLFHSLFLVSMDFFLDKPINRDKQTAITAYAALQYSDYGKNYLRSVGPMNPSTSSNNPTVLNGPGNNLPIIGTGTTVFTQLGALLPKNWLQCGQLQPYVCSQISNFERAGKVVGIYNFGFNLLLDGQRAKLSLDLQNRPILNVSNVNGQQFGRKNMFVLQYQINI